MLVVLGGSIRRDVVVRGGGSLVELVKLLGC